MNKIIIIVISLIVSEFTATSQTKLPDTVTIRLSQRDLFAISQRVDSLQSLLTATSVLPANQVTSFNQRLNIALSVMYNQIRAQMVADKVKKVDVPKKKK